MTTRRDLLRGAAAAVPAAALGGLPVVGQAAVAAADPYEGLPRGLQSLVLAQKAMALSLDRRRQLVAELRQEGFPADFVDAFEAVLMKGGADGDASE